MMKFWVHVLRDRFLKPRTAFLPAEPASQVATGAACSLPRASRILPAIPLYPLNLFAPGARALDSDQAVLDAVTVGRSILNVFVEWTDTGVYSPARCKKDLDSHHAIYERLRQRVPPQVHTRVPIERVEALAWQYVRELGRDIAFMRSYARDDFDASGLMVDFAHTIGCGEALEAALAAGARA